MINGGIKTKNNSFPSNVCIQFTNFGGHLIIKYNKNIPNPIRARLAIIRLIGSNKWMSINFSTSILSQNHIKHCKSRAYKINIQKYIDKNYIPHI